jgi:hypothetical protein
MRRQRLLLYPGVGAAFAVLVCCGNAYAYIDPGTGSYILQIVIASLVGAAFTLKLFWKRLRLFVSNAFSKRKDRREERPPGKDE